MGSSDPPQQSPLALTLICVQDLLKAGLGDGNPLLSLDLDDALASINGFLAKARWWVFPLA